MAISAERKAELRALVKDWKLFVEGVKELTEEECQYLLSREMKTKKRDSFVVRLYGRCNKCRRTRELNELRKHTTKTPVYNRRRTDSEKRAGA